MAEHKAAKKSKSKNKNGKAGQEEQNQDKKAAASSLDSHFKPCADVKGLRFGAQLVTRALTVRRASPLELPHLLRAPGAAAAAPAFAPTTTAYIPTNFTILAHHAWHTLTLGIGTKKSKAAVFVFESGAMKAAADTTWPAVVPLGDVNRRLVRALPAVEMARFKFRKGCITFYVYAVRSAGARGFARADELKAIVEAVAKLKDFLDHTAMLALPGQRSIDSAAVAAPMGVVH